MVKKTVETPSFWAASLVIAACLDNNVPLLFAEAKDVKFESSATFCPRRNVLLLEQENYLHSTNHEDQCLLSFFNGLCHGLYLDTGAGNGLVDSTTHVFHGTPGLDWKGINIEMIPHTFRELELIRANDLANVHAAICLEPQTLHYVEMPSREYEGETPSGFWEFASEKQRRRNWPGLLLEDTTPIQCVPMQSILDEVLLEEEDGKSEEELVEKEDDEAEEELYRSGSSASTKSFFDFWRMNNEGAELTALTTVDFDRVGFGVILIRENYTMESYNAEIIEFLNSKGYNRIEEFGSRRGCEESKDIWFINRNFESIYGGSTVPKAARRNLRR